MRWMLPLFAGAASIVLFIVFTYPVAGENKYVSLEIVDSDNGPIITKIHPRGLPYIEGEGWYRLYSFWTYHVIVIVNDGPPWDPGRNHYYHFIAPNYISLFLEGTCDGFTLIDNIYQIYSYLPWGFEGMCGCSFCQVMTTGSHTVYVDSNIYPWVLKYGNSSVKIIPAACDNAAKLAYTYGGRLLPLNWLPHCAFMVSQYEGESKIVVKLESGVWHVDTPQGSYAVPYMQYNDVYIDVFFSWLGYSVDVVNVYTPWGALIRGTQYITTHDVYAPLGWGSPPLVTFNPFRQMWAEHAAFTPNGLLLLYPYLVYLPKGCRLYIPYSDKVGIGINVPRR